MKQATERPTRSTARRPYRRPTLRRWGHLACVTRKSGAIADQKQVTKPGLGGG